MVSMLLADTTTWYPVLFDTPLNIASGVFFWVTVALVLAFLVAAFVLKGEKRSRFVKIAVFCAVCYACVVGIVLLALTFSEDEIRAELFYPLLVLIVCIAASAIAIALKPKKVTLIVAASVTGAAAIAVLVCMFIFGGGEEDGITSLDNILLYVSAAVLVALLAFFTFFFGRKDKKGFDAKSITYAAVCIAMSFALSYLRIFRLPQAGSVTIASLLPLMIYSYMFGVKKGVLAGLIYGVLQAIQDPWIIHPAQFLLDYPIAFAFIGIAGLFANVKKLDKLPQIQFALGAVAGSALRYVSHVLSGVFAFADLGADPVGAWVYSLTYNSFVFMDVAIVIAVGVIVFCSPSFVKAVRKYRAKKPAETEDTQNAEKV